jgi:hypothetical protein
MLHNIQQIGYNINIERGKGNKEVLKMDKWQIRTCEMAIRDCEARLVGAKEEGEWEEVKHLEFLIEKNKKKLEGGNC